MNGLLVIIWPNYNILKEQVSAVQALPLISTKIGPSKKKQHSNSYSHNHITQTVDSSSEEESSHPPSLVSEVSVQGHRLQQYMHQFASADPVSPCQTLLA